MDLSNYSVSNYSSSIYFSDLEDKLCRMNRKNIGIGSRQLILLEILILLVFIPILLNGYPVGRNDRWLNICIPCAIAFLLYTTTDQRGSSAFRSLRSHRSHQLNRRCSRCARLSNGSSCSALPCTCRSIALISTSCRDRYSCHVRRNCPAAISHQ